MNILLVGINSRFTHTNLALRYMRESLLINNIEVELKEYTINNEIDYIIGDLNYKFYDFICFSVYIWNVEEIKKITEIIKKSCPQIKTIFGGPEVTYNSKEFMEKYSFADYIIKGEGEKILPLLYKSIENNKDLDFLSGVLFKRDNEIIETKGINKIQNFETIPFPYDFEYKQNNKEDFFKNKYIYYETTRGCPFKCGFCLSSNELGVRALNLDRVKEDLDRIYQLKPMIIKFVDRTFNYDWKRSKAIMEYIIEKNKNIKIHYEITADIINDRFLDFLKEVPKDIFQFEIGIQSTNEAVLKEIHRKMDFENIKYVIKELNEKRNIHMHVDLIAGLPKENYRSFIKSFNEAYNLKTEKLQLGFLKVLKGTDVYERRKSNGIVFKSFAPYEVIKTKDILAEEIEELKKVESILNKYYSEGYFVNSINYLINNFYENPYEFYLEMSRYWDEKKYFNRYHKRKVLYDILYEFSKKNNYYNTEFEKELIIDYVIHNKNLELPKYLNRERENIYKTLKKNISRSQYFIKKYFQSIYIKYNKKIINEFRIIVIKERVYLFIYGNRCNVEDITEEIKKLEESFR